MRIDPYTVAVQSIMPTDMCPAPQNAVRDDSSKLSKRLEFVTGPAVIPAAPCQVNSQLLLQFLDRA